MIARFVFCALGLLAVHAALAETHEMKGVVLDLRPDTQTAVIRHEAVPGFMPAMTMPFSVPDEEEFGRLEELDRVRFEFVMEDTGSFARGFEVIGKEPVTPTESNRPGQTDRAQVVKEGSPAPRVELTDQFGKTTRLRASDGRLTVLTFIFTRCPVPEFCPLITQRFGMLQRRLKEEELIDSVRLLSVTIDPEYDTPEVLRNYGESVGADFDHWQFATAEQEKIDRLTDAFRVFIEKDGMQLDHALCTALIAPDGETLEIWRGNRWTVEEVLARIEKAAGR